MSNSEMFTMIGCLLVMLCGYSKSASNKRCLPLYEGGSYCFIRPDPPLTLSWSSAMEWCGNIGATLPIADSSYHYSVFQNALGYFGLQAETLWLGANSTNDPSNWFWTNGSSFTGAIEERSSAGQTNACIMRNGTDLTFVPANPYDYNSYICRVSYSETDCASSPRSYWTNGKCYYKNQYSGYSSSWYSYLSNCAQSNRISYEEFKELSRWLDSSAKYWVALRCGWWTWHNIVNGSSFQMGEDDIYRYSIGLTDGQCLASYRNSYGSYGWSGVNCSRSLQFVCQQNLNATMTKITTIETSADMTTDSGSKKYPPARTSDQGLAVWVKAVLGVGGGVLFLALTIWLTHLTVKTYRRIRGANYSLVDLQNQSHANPKTTWSNAYDNCAINIASETAEMKAARSSY